MEGLGSFFLGKTLWGHSLFRPGTKRDRNKTKSFFSKTLAKQPFKYKKFKYNLEILQNKREIKRFNLQGYEKREWILLGEKKINKIINLNC